MLRLVIENVWRQILRRDLALNKRGNVKRGNQGNKTSFCYSRVGKSRLIFILRTFSELSLQSLDFLLPLQLFYRKRLTRFKLPSLHSYREKPVALPTCVGTFIIRIDEWDSTFSGTIGAFYCQYCHTLPSRRRFNCYYVQIITRLSLDCSSPNPRGPKTTK